MTKLNCRLSRLAIAATLTSLSWVSMNPSVVIAQCSSGNCGNVGVADGFGGFRSVAYGAASTYSIANNPMRSGMGYGTNGGYGTWGHRAAQPLFDNYFTQGNANQADAALYISPVGVPGWVGHTYNTYQPLYPHEFLYTHVDKYHSYYDQGRGLNRTKAVYWAPPVHTAIKQIHHKLEVPR